MSQYDNTTPEGNGQNPYSQGSAPDYSSYGQQQGGYATGPTSQGSANYGGYTPGPGGNYSNTPTATSQKGFFASLFDVSFDSFVTPSVVKIAYIISMVIIGITALFFLIGAFASGEALVIIMALIATPIVCIFYLVLIRMSLEFYYATIRMSEDIHHRLPGKR